MHEYFKSTMKPKRKTMSQDKAQENSQQETSQNPSSPTGRRSHGNKQSKQKSSEKQDSSAQASVTRSKTHKNKQTNVQGSLTDDQNEEKQETTQVDFTEEGEDVCMTVHLSAQDEHKFMDENSSSDEEEDYNDSSLNNNNKNATAESSSEDDEQQDSLSEQEFSQESGEIQDQEEDEFSRYKSPRKEKKQKRKSLMTTFKKMQEIVSKKGYIDAKSPEKLTRDVNIKDSEPNRFNYRAPKCRTGRGDRDQQTTRCKAGKSNHLLERGDLAESPSEVTIYRNAVKNKIGHRRASLSSEDQEIKFNYNAHTITEQDDIDEYSPPNRFIAEICRHYENKQ